MKDKKKMKEIREAVCANRGGLEEATDSQIMTIWNSLDKATQTKYIESIKERKGQDAPGNKPQSKI